MASNKPKYPNLWRNTWKSGFFSHWEKWISKKKSKKISVFEIKKWSQTFLNMPVLGEIPKNPSLQQFWTPKTAKSYETNLNRYFCTDFIEVKVKKFLWKKTWKLLQISEIQKVASNVAKCANSLRNIKKLKFAKFANFRNLQNSSKNCQMYQFVERYEKKSSLDKFANFRNRQNSPKSYQMRRFVEKNREIWVCEILKFL